VIATDIAGERKIKSDFDVVDETHGHYPMLEPPAELDHLVA